MEADGWVGVGGCGWGINSLLELYAAVASPWSSNTYVSRFG